MSKKEFLQLEQNKSLKTGILSSAIVCYVCAALTAIIGLGGTQIANLQGSPSMLIDAGLLVLFGLLIQLKQSFPGAVVLLVYGIINIVVMVLLTGTVGGWLIILIGICAVYYTYKFNKAYKAFNAESNMYNNPMEK